VATGGRDAPALLRRTATQAGKPRLRLNDLQVVVDATRSNPELNTN
jgi:hypothetical protein